MSVEVEEAEALAECAIAADKGADVPLHFDGENSYPECQRCGACCQVNVLAMTHEEVARIRAYMVEHDVRPIDRHKESCCFQNENGDGCMVWPVRARVCRFWYQSPRCSGFL